LRHGVEVAVSILRFQLLRQVTKVNLGLLQKAVNSTWWFSICDTCSSSDRLQ